MTHRHHERTARKGGKWAVPNVGVQGKNAVDGTTFLISTDLRQMSCIGMAHREEP